MNRQQLLDSLTIVKPGLKRNSTIEQSLFFFFKKRRVYTYNDEICISSPTPLDLSGAVKAEEFYQFLSKSSSKEVVITETETALQVKAGKSKSGISISKDIDMPLPNFFKLTWGKLIKGFSSYLNFVVSSVPVDTSISILSCLHIHESTIEATNNYCACRVSIEEGMANDSFLLPINCIKYIKSIEPTHFAIAKEWIHFRKDKIVLSCRVFDAKEYDFPDLEPIFNIDDSEKKDVIKLPDDFKEVIKKACIFTNNKQKLEKEIEIYISPGKLSVKSKSSYGWFEEEADTLYNGEPCTFSISPFSLEFILDQNDCESYLFSNKLLFKKDNWEFIVSIKVL